MYAALVPSPDGRVATDFTQISYDVSEHIATITLSRPEQLNVFTGTMMRELIAAFDLADADDDVRAVIMTGAGRAFCAGADLSGGGSTFARGGSDVTTDVGVPRDGGGMVALRIYASHKPVIGAINGAAVGVGVTMTLPMDIRIASTTARFGFVFARRGIVPEAASSWFLPRVVGISQALGVELLRAARSPPTRRSPGGWCAASTSPTTCCRRRGRSPPRSRTNAAPVSVALTRQMMWRMLGADHPMARPSRRQPGDHAARPQRRQPRGRDELPREAPGGRSPTG